MCISNFVLQMDKTFDLFLSPVHFEHYDTFAPGWASDIISLINAAEQSAGTAGGYQLLAARPVPDDGFKVKVKA